MLFDKGMRHTEEVQDATSKLCSSVLAFVLIDRASCRVMKIEQTIVPSSGADQLGSPVGVKDSWVT